MNISKFTNSIWQILPYRSISCVFFLFSFIFSLASTNDEVIITVEQAEIIEILSIAGHGSDGSLLGVDDTNSYDVYSASTEIKFETCFTSTACYKSATTGTGLDTKHGITSLGRAGSKEKHNWPMVRKGAHTALESTTKGFVITRMASPETTVKNPVEGMIVFDTDEGTTGCLKIYDGTSWKCFKTQTCDK